MINSPFLAYNNPGNQDMMLQQQFEEAPTYMPPEDPNYACNFDRFLEAITPKVSLQHLEKTTLKEFFNAFKNASVFGLKVEFLNE